jgi:hypothetical protein
MVARKTVVEYSPNSKVSDKIREIWGKVVQMLENE